MSKTGWTENRAIERKSFQSSILASIIFNLIELSKQDLFVMRGNRETGIDWREGYEVMIAAEAAASVFGFSRREVYLMVEAGAIHFTETDAGILFVCLKSLENNFPGNKDKD